ncbi:alpha/beta fold hydrolase [Curtobacterium luteum]|uniref:alpha/beta fold hydrolase n=1 Tax=Curtobacterium luteum TaxID=33881 RepID=UPI00382D4373
MVPHPLRPGTVPTRRIDQRGSGKSRPAGGPTGEMDRQNAQQLIDDIEAVRRTLGIDAWVVTGISWGTTLALAYAQRHPQRVSALALMAVTTTSRSEVDRITEGVGRLFSAEWDEFERASQRRPGERVVEAYAHLLASSDASTAAAAAISAPPVAPRATGNVVTWWRADTQPAYLLGLRQGGRRSWLDLQPEVTLQPAGELCLLFRRQRLIERVTADEVVLDERTDRHHKVVVDRADQAVKPNRRPFTIDVSLIGNKLETGLEAWADLGVRVVVRQRAVDGGTSRTEQSLLNVIGTCRGE